MNEKEVKRSKIREEEREKRRKKRRRIVLIEKILVGVVCMMILCGAGILVA